MNKIGAFAVSLSIVMISVKGLEIPLDVAVSDFSSKIVSDERVKVEKFVKIMWCRCNNWSNS